MGAVLMYIARFLVSIKGVLVTCLPGLFAWLLKSKVFWCFFAMYACVRGSLVAYRWIVSFLLDSVLSYSVVSPSSTSLSLLSYANAVVPIDEIGAAFVILGSAYGLRFALRWVRTAYGLVPFKAT